MFFESAAPIEVAYAKCTLHVGDRGYGLLVSMWGIGVVAGSIVFARPNTRALGRMVSLGTLAVGLAYVGFAAAPSLARRLRGRGGRRGRQRRAVARR